VTHDLLGLNPGKPPKFVKEYADLRQQMLSAVSRFKQEVETGGFPAERYWYK
jgi:3-methyl-2-oxobutanoate hydroxymethyltransferase